MRRSTAIFAILLVLAGCQSGPDVTREEKLAAERKVPGTVILGAVRGFGPAPEFVFHRYDRDAKVLRGKPFAATPFHGKPRYETANGLAFALLDLEPGDYVLSSVVYRINAYPVRNVNIHCMDRGAHRFTVEPGGVHYLGDFATDAKAQAFVHSAGDLGNVRNLLRNFPNLRGEPVTVAPDLVDFVHEPVCAGVSQ